MYVACSLTQTMLLQKGVWHRTTGSCLHSMMLQVILLSFYETFLFRSNAIMSSKSPFSSENLSRSDG